MIVCFALIAFLYDFYYDENGDLITIERNQKVKNIAMGVLIADAYIFVIVCILYGLLS